MANQLTPEAVSRWSVARDYLNAHWDIGKKLPLYACQQLWLGKALYHDDENERGQATQFLIRSLSGAQNDTLFEDANIEEEIRNYRTNNLESSLAAAKTALNQREEDAQAYKGTCAELEHSLLGQMDDQPDHMLVERIGSLLRKFLEHADTVHPEYNCRAFVVENINQKEKFNLLFGA